MKLSRFYYRINGLDYMTFNSLKDAREALCEIRKRDGVEAKRLRMLRIPNMEAIVRRSWESDAMSFFYA